MHLIAFIEHEFRQVRTVLSSHSRDQCFLHFNPVERFRKIIDSA
jgi:hypothetical protein